QAEALIVAWQIDRYRVMPGRFEQGNNTMPVPCDTTRAGNEYKVSHLASMTRRPVLIVARIADCAPPERKVDDGSVCASPPHFLRAAVGTLQEQQPVPLLHGADSNGAERDLLLYWAPRSKGGKPG